MEKGVRFPEEAIDLMAQLYAGKKYKGVAIQKEAFRKALRRKIGQAKQNTGKKSLKTSDDKLPQEFEELDEENKLIVIEKLVAVVIQSLKKLVEENIVNLEKKEEKEEDGSDDM